MFFENLTLFEIQLDGAQFWPKTMRGDDVAPHESTDDVAHAESGGRGRLLPVVMLAALGIGAAALYRRSRSTADVELEADGEDAEADLATAQ